MCKPMTDERLEAIDQDLNGPLSEVSFSVQTIRDILKEVRRLRAEAIVWHPWPGEKPERERYYLISTKDQVDISLDSWTRGRWGIFHHVDITAWAELPAPYGGE